MTRRLRLAIPLALALFLADCASKDLAEAYLVPEHVAHPVIGNVVRFTLVHNHGAAMSLPVGPYGLVLLVVFGLIAASLMTRMIWETPVNATLRRVALGMLLGGAIGNLAGRAFSRRGLETPYVCGAPCVFTFTAVQGCGGNSSFSWAVRDAAGGVLASRFGPVVSHYEFSALGIYSVLEGESSQTCGTGGTFRVQVVDRTPPETMITSGPAAVSADPAPSFTFSASEPGTTFECRLDALAFSACSSPTVTPPLTDGAHALAVRATDAAGNTDPTPATYAFTVRRPTPVAASLRQAWRHDRRSTTVRRLELRELPSNAQVTVTCSGRGCPFTTRRFTPRAKAVSLTAAFRHARLAARTAIVIRVDAPGAITRQFRLTTRAFPWDPRLQVTCVPATAC